MARINSSCVDAWSEHKEAKEMSMLNNRKDMEFPLFE
jgi:hypothetical protein